MISHICFDTYNVISMLYETVDSFIRSEPTYHLLCLWLIALALPKRLERCSLIRERCTLLFDAPINGYKEESVTSMIAIVRSTELAEPENKRTANVLSLF